jgi:hypothetical protein
MPKHVGGEKILEGINKEIRDFLEHLLALLQAILQDARFKHQEGNYFL